MNGIFLFFLFLFKSFSAVIKVVLVWRVNVCQASVCDFTQMQQLPASLGQTKVSSLWTRYTCRSAREWKFNLSWCILPHIRTFQFHPWASTIETCAHNHPQIATSEPRSRLHSSVGVHTATASAPFCLCCSLIDGKMSHSLPLITSPELMSPTLNILPPSLPPFIFHYLSSIPPSLGLVKAPFSSIWSGADPTFGKMLEALCSRNTTVIHHIGGRTVYQLSETTVPAQCCEYALLIVSDC